MIKFICVMVLLQLFTLPSLSSANDDKTKSSFSLATSAKKTVIPLNDLKYQSVLANNSSNTKLAPTAKSSSIVQRKDDASFLSKQPPPGFIYLTFIVALFGLITSFVGFIVKRIDRVVDRVYTIKQEYWTKTFLVPVCLEPLRELILTSSDRISSINDPNEPDKLTYEEFDKQFKKDKTKVLNYLLIIDAFNNEVYTKIATQLDDLEDTITKYCYANISNVGRDSEFYSYKLPGLATRSLFLCLSEILVVVSQNNNNLFMGGKNAAQFLKDELRGLFLRVVPAPKCNPDKTKIAG